MQEAKPLVSTPGQSAQSRGSCAREACASSALGRSPACSGLGGLQPRTPGAYLDSPERPFEQRPVP